MNAIADPDFAPIETRIRDNVGRQGFMTHVGAELSELTRGACTLAVDRRPELVTPISLVAGRGSIPSPSLDPPLQLRLHVTRPSAGSSWIA